MKNKGLLILFGGIVLIGLAFLLLNFRAAVSNTQVDKIVSTTDMGDKLPTPMQQKAKISVALVGEGYLVSALRKSVQEKLDEAGIGEIELVQGRQPVYPNPVLVIKVGKAGPIWTPFFAASQFSIIAGYASNGDSTFIETVEETHTTVGKPDVSIMYGEYDLKDRSFGLISLRGYQQYLGDYLAEEIVGALKAMYNE